MITKESLDIAAIRARLSASKGKEYWRSLEALASSEDFNKFLHHEFPRQASIWAGTLDRRQLLQLMGASLALAGLTGCGRQPPEQIVPYVEAPETVTPGVPLFFATATTLNGIGLGVLVESHMGRPIKVEGNPDHPGSLGATDIFAQASVLTLYDPDRSQAIINQGQGIRTWENFVREFTPALEAQLEDGGSGLRILTESTTSPTLIDQIQRFQARFPQARWHQYDPVAPDNTEAGARLAFGEEAHTLYRFEEADVVFALDADFLACIPGNIRYARDFANRRRIQGPQAEMNRLYVIESSTSVTGTSADHRLGVLASQIETVARSLAAALGVSGVVGVTLPAGVSEAWFTALVQDLQEHPGRSLVIVGDHQPPIVHALGHAINAALGNIGRTVIHTEPLRVNPAPSESHMQSLRTLVTEMAAGQVEMLLILGGNPVYTAPADLNFATHLPKVPFTLHLSLYEDETSDLCLWHIPETHTMEAWGDVRGFDGTMSIIQPLIAPLYDGNRSIYEVMSLLTGQLERAGYDIVRTYWQGRFAAGGMGGGSFEQTWRTAVHDGIIPNTALVQKSVALQPASAWLAGTAEPPPPSGLELHFRPDPTIWDGRFANNGWLQELPKPITKLTWDNAALIGPATAEQLQLTSGDLVELRYQGRTVQAPVWIVPGQPHNAVTVSLGYGRQRGGKVAPELGFNAYTLRTSEAPWFDGGLELRKVGQDYPLANTQGHHQLQGRDIVRVGTLDEYLANPEHPEFAQGHHSVETAGEGADPSLIPSLYPEYVYEGYAWGMAIDLTVCTGCNACVIACQAENNIPVVGKTDVLRSREMHWLRVDTYFTGDLENPESYNVPVPCMHCEKAPCEPVCPVAATVHSSEGLNDMVYNRCVGTRYCSNNCPYKVRRFNFLEHSSDTSPVLQLLHNPDVTVRSRGVMEKCTYCVQRINVARINAEKEGRQIVDGEVLTACQAVCPTQAIIFGDINDPASQVSQRKAQALNYSMLAELGTQPRTTYLAAVRNPNPALTTGTEEHH